MPVASFDVLDGLYVVISVFLLVLAVALLYVLYRLAQTLQEWTALQRGIQSKLLPVVSKVGGSLDRVNLQLDKVDQMTDSAVDITDNLDTTVRAVTIAITRPVQIVSGFATGIAHGVSSIRARRGVGDSVEAGKEAARQRVEDIGHELNTKKRPSRPSDAAESAGPRPED